MSPLRQDRAPEEIPDSITLISLFQYHWLHQSEVVRGEGLRGEGLCGHSIYQQQGVRAGSQKAFGELLRAKTGGKAASAQGG